MEVELEANGRGSRRLTVGGLEAEIPLGAVAVRVDKGGLDERRDRQGHDGARVGGVVEQPPLANLDVEDVREGLELHAVPRSARLVDDVRGAIVDAPVGEFDVEGVERARRAEVDGDRDGGRVVIAALDVFRPIHAVPAVPGVDPESLEGHGEDADAVLRHEGRSQIRRGGGWAARERGRVAPEL